MSDVAQKKPDLDSDS